jgi:hypothetical protein
MSAPRLSAENSASEGLNRVAVKHRFRSVALIISDTSCTGRIDRFVINHITEAKTVLGLTVPRFFKSSLPSLTVSSYLMAAPLR